MEWLQIVSSEFKSGFWLRCANLKSDRQFIKSTHKLPINKSPIPRPFLQRLRHQQLHLAPNRPAARYLTKPSEHCTLPYGSPSLHLQIHPKIFNPPSLPPAHRHRPLAHFVPPPSPQKPRYFWVQGNEVGGTQLNQI